MSTYEVGSVIWIIHTDRPGLMAYRVVEEITKKTLEGEQIQYLVESATNKSKTVKLESIKGNIYEDSEEAKQKMIENATKAIDGMVIKIQSNVDRYFNGKPEKTINKSEPVIKVKATTSELKSGHQWVVMEDGTKVQVKIPEIMK